MQAIAQTAERGLFDLIFMGDNLYADPAAHPSYTVRLEPLTMPAAVAATTRHIGLGATMSTTYSDPPHRGACHGRACLERRHQCEPGGGVEFRVTAPRPRATLCHRGRVRRRGQRTLGLLGGRRHRRRSRLRPVYRPGAGPQARPRQRIFQSRRAIEHRPRATGSLGWCCKPAARTLAWLWRPARRMSCSPWFRASRKRRRSMPRSKAACPAVTGCRPTS